MPGPTLLLTGGDLAALAEAVDPVALAAAAATGVRAPGRLLPWGRDGLVLLDRHPSGGCVLPAAALRDLRTAALAALAARTLVAPGVVTAAVLGDGPVATAAVGLAARALPGLSHVAVQPLDGPAAPVSPALVRRLESAGVGWAVPVDLAGTLFGATLVLATAPTAEWEDVRRVPPGTTLVNTSGHDLPDALHEAADQVFVDDTAQLPLHPGRRVARPRPGAPRPDPAGLAELLTGARPGRTHPDEVLLMEVLGTGGLDAGLAGALHRAALDHGFGVPLP